MCVTLFIRILLGEKYTKVVFSDENSVSICAMEYILSSTSVYSEGEVCS